MIRSPDGKNAAIVDPGDAAPVQKALTERGLTLSAILLTHHHADHAGGVMTLRQAGGVTVYGPAGEDIPGVDRPLFDGDTIAVDGLPLSLRVIDVPGHTSGHIAYFTEGYGGTSGPTVDPRPVLFCGDTLFAAGCGRLFEGTPAQMLNSLDRLAALPADTLVYCAHEYTLSNLRFAVAADPETAEVHERLDEAQRMRGQDLETVPSSIDIERRTNPFLRTREASVRRQIASRMTAERSAAGAQASAADAQATAAGAHTASDDAKIFAAVRKWKDNFR